MGSSKAAAVIAFFILAAAVPNSSTEKNDIPGGEDAIIDAESLCGWCKCRADEATCDDGGNGRRLITIKSLPRNIRRLEITNLSGRLVLARGAIVAAADDGNTEVTVAGGESLMVEEKSIGLLGPASTVYLGVVGVRKVTFETGAVSARSGHFSVNVTAAEEVKVAGQSFGVLRRADFVDIGILALSDGSFKPNSAQWKADLELSMERVRSVPALSANSFASAKSIVLKECVIKEIASNAFSGFQIESVRFDNCSVDRMQRDSFPEQILISHLVFDKCTLTSLSEHSIRSAISTLEVTSTKILSMSEGAFSCHVARVIISDNVFQTLASRALLFQSWNDFVMVGNEIKFFEQNALAGISNPSREENITFAFRDNEISYTNRDAFKHSFPDTVVKDVGGNSFNRECDCDFMSWIEIVCGSGGLAMKEAIKTTSLCRVQEYYSKCFQDPKVLVTAYVAKVCAAFSDAESECLAETLDLWQLFHDHVEVSSTKGILIVILVFAIAFSLLLSIYTLLRWIVYTVQTRMRVKNEDEWNFTKIEERMAEEQQSPSQQSVADHYERLPLTKADGGGGGSVDTEHSNLLKDEVKEVSAAAAPAEAGSSSKRHSRQYLSDQPPTLTFYDEMIDLLKEKLDDPDNYATVADLAAPVPGTGEAACTEELYIDPKTKEHKDC